MPLARSARRCGGTPTSAGSTAPGEPRPTDKMHAVRPAAMVFCMILVFFLSYRSTSAAGIFLGGSASFLASFSIPFPA